MNVKVYNTATKVGKFGVGLVASASVGAVMGHVFNKVVPTDLPMPKKVMAVIGMSLVTMYVADKVAEHLIETLDQIFPEIPEPAEESKDETSAEEPEIQGEIVDE
jgi:hypothetical protein